MEREKKNKTASTIEIIFLTIGLIGAFLKCTMDIKRDTANIVSPAYNKISTTISDATGDNTEKILSEYADVKFDKLEISKDKYGYIDSELKVTVTNKTNEKKSFYFEFEAVNESGTRIMIDNLYANDLASGQSAEYKIFTYIEEDKYDEMKNATIKIYEASMA